MQRRAMPESGEAAPIGQNRLDRMQRIVDCFHDGRSFITGSGTTIAQSAMPFHRYPTPWMGQKWRPGRIVTGEPHLVETELLVGVVTVLFHSCGWVTLSAVRSSAGPRRLALGDQLLLFWMIGLGSITLLSAWLKFNIALASGCSCTLLLLALLSRSQLAASHDTDPYTRLYADEPID